LELEEELLEKKREEGEVMSESVFFSLRPQDEKGNLKTVSL
jgi:hypothetical protein